MSSLKLALCFLVVVMHNMLSGAPLANAPELESAGLQGNLSTDWWAQTQDNIRASEYYATHQADGLQAPNRAQNLRTWFDEEGALSVPRDAASRAAAPWQWGLSLRSYGWKNGVLEKVSGAKPAATGNIVTYQRGNLTEWYQNDEKGVESFYRIDDAPAGEAGVLRVELAVRGNTRAKMSADGKAIGFAAPSRAQVVSYGGLVAKDARGRDLLSRMELVDGSDRQFVMLDVDVTGAAFPVIIDPLATSSAWTAEGNQTNAKFGNSVASAGDVNGDGYSDVIVGADIYDNGETDEGRAFLYLGSASGLAATASWTAEGNQVNANFGGSVASAGDVNGDGYSDVIIGATGYEYGESDEGWAFVYLGSATGLATSAVWTAEGNQASASFGASVASAGDVNGDGYSDVIVGAFESDNGETDEGRAFVYLGSATGLATSAAWIAEGNQASASFGVSVASAGDVNGDGYSDVIVGADTYDNGQPDEGRAYVYLGSASGLAATAAWTAENNQAFNIFGHSVASAGDVNGDGYSDVIVGAFLYDNGENNEGRAFVYLGSATGLTATAAWTAESNQASAFFGYSVASAGDVNGDGYSDVIVGAYTYDNGQSNEGRTFVYLGSATGLAPTAAWTAESDQALGFFGYSVASAGDVNGDGYSDVIIGAYEYDNGETDEGRAYVYLGSATGLAATAGGSAESDQANALLGYSVASTGDVNGDGYSDVIVGAPNYDNGETDEGRVYVFLGSATGLTTGTTWAAESDQASAFFGRSVASAGDVNGDGYSDVIVGAYGFDNDETDEGRAFVYLGSASGLAATTAWTAESDQPSANFGYSVASAGDVNGDGYSDVVVGAYSYDNGQTNEGWASVYLGSASGLAATAAWTAESDQASANFGWSVASAGDVNGDGYSDVIVGAYGYDNGETDEGRAFVYLGSASGLATTAIWTSESNQASANFGWSVASAGDVNGDGYSDVIIGASTYDNGETDEGRALVYLGSMSGLMATEAWTAESNQASAFFGISVSSAGDVNGDGFSDVIVGSQFYDNNQQNEGRAYVYLGAASGLTATAAWTTESDQSAANFGCSVASAGDVNGDGYSDVIVGANTYDNGETNEGRAFVYYGNGEAGPGMSLAPRQRRGDNTAPIALGGYQNNPAGLRLAALGRSPYGRGKVKLQWEIKPANALFDGSGLGQSLAWTDTETSGSALNELIGGMPSGTRFHWRVRLLYKGSSAWPQQASRWVTYPSQIERTMFRTNASPVADWAIY